MITSQGAGAYARLLLSGGDYGRASPPRACFGLPPDGQGLPRGWQRHDGSQVSVYSELLLLLLFSLFMRVPFACRVRILLQRFGCYPSVMQGLPSDRTTG